MARYCPHCGARNPTTNRFCDSCEADMMAPMPYGGLPPEPKKKKGLSQFTLLLIIVAFAILLAGAMCIGFATMSGQPPG